MELKVKIEKIKQFDFREFILQNQISFLVLGIFVFAFFLRIWNIELIPGGYSRQEDPTVRAIASLTREDMWLKDGYYNAAYIYLGYLWGQLFELSVVSLRYLSALIGTLTVILSYLFISSWFSRKVAVFMTLLFASSSFHIAVSRVILPEILLPFILFSLFLSLTYAYRTKNIWLFGLSGVFAGLGFYTSPAFFLVPLIFLFSGWYFYSKNKKFFLSYKQELLVALVGFVAVIIPYFVSFVENPRPYLDYYNFSVSLQGLVMNFSQITSLLFLEGPKNYLYNLGSEPLLDPLIFVSSVFGLLLAALSIQRRKYLFIILWLFFMSIYASLKPNLSGADLLGLLPVLYVLSAFVIDYILERWLKTFPFNKGARIFVVGLISVFFTLSVLYNYEKYFVGYKYSTAVEKGFSVESPIKLK